jgi:hypothetical protein
MTLEKFPDHARPIGLTIGAWTLPLSRNVQANWR